MNCYLFLLSNSIIICFYYSILSDTNFNVSIHKGLERVFYHQGKSPFFNISETFFFYVPICFVILIFKDGIT